MTTPVKLRDVYNHHFDSTLWNDVNFRDDDIVIGSYAKSGTTWLQQIVAQLLFAGRDDVDLSVASPWVDLRTVQREARQAALEAQTHRRFLKTHLPLDALVCSPQARYLYVARDARDVVWSLHHHHRHAVPEWYAMLNDTPGLVGPPMGPPNPDVRAYWRRWMDEDGFPFWPYWEHIRGWWQVRHWPGLQLVHFEELKRDLPGAIERIAKFIEVPIAASRREAILEHCSFAWMKSRAAQVVPNAGRLWRNGPETFLHRGVNGRWRDVLSATASAAYERRAVEELGAEAAHWLATGERPA